MHCTLHSCTSYRSTCRFPSGYHIVLLGVFSVASALIGSPVLAMAADGVPDADRIDAIAEMLPDLPQGVGRPAGDREAWDAVAQHPKFDGIVARAEDLLDEPMPELTDELFLDFSKTGNRTRCQRVISQRRSRVATLALAECLENQGRFVPELQRAIAEVCSEKTWVLPAHDRSLANFRGETTEIDLNAAATGWLLATADYWLAEKLDNDTRSIIRENLEQRIFTPFEQAIETGQPRLWWLTGTNNWNAVCLAGVVGAAQENIPSTQRRAYFVAAAEKYIEYFLQGFTSDGYCSEGLGYWNYGFGHFAMLAETIYQATGGELDWMARPVVRPIALFAYRMELTPGVYPAFADCGFGARPDPVLMAYLSRRFQLGLSDLEEDYLLLNAGPTTSLFSFGLYRFANSATAQPANSEPLVHEVRDWFPEAGILICRSGKSADGMAAALKGGHNAEHHNHNDLGSFVVALGEEVPLVDPGSEVYTARTFSGQRYESDLLSSFGHPVPVVAGQLQRTGRNAAAEVVETEFTEDHDRLLLDIRSAYAVDGLRTLTRQFVFSRQGRGRLEVTDTVAFSQPQTFESALVTFSEWEQLDSTRLRIGTGHDAVMVTVETGGIPIEVRGETIEEDITYRKKPTRLGIRLTEPVAEAVVRLIVEPAAQ